MQNIEEILKNTMRYLKKKELKDRQKRGVEEEEETEDDDEEEEGKVVREKKR